MTGTQYGYDQYWSSAKSGMVDVYIYSKSIQRVQRMSGEDLQKYLYRMCLKGFQYIENQPFQISFEAVMLKRLEEGVLE